MDQHDDHIESAKLHLARAEALVEQQERRLEALRADGHDTTNAVAFLRVLKETREVMRRDLEAVQAGAVTKERLVQ